MPRAFPLPSAPPSALGLDQAHLSRLGTIVARHVADKRYPGGQLAVARNGSLAMTMSVGDARIEPRMPAADDTLWLVYSNTKVIVACAIWLLVEQGALRFADAIAAHVPEFAANGKGDITILQLLTHQAGFPGAVVPAAAWNDHARVRQIVSQFTLEWEPGSRVSYHGLSAHWVAAVLIEAVTGTDYRDFIRERIIEPLGLGDELFLGLPSAAQARTADMHDASPDGTRHTRRTEENNSHFQSAGVPAAGAYATARAMAAFYQMLAGQGTLGDVRLLSPRMVAYVTRNFTGDRVDDYVGMPMHRGLGPHLRGSTDTIRGLGTLASPRTFGHSGIGSSYCWADPDSGVSFAYLTNSRANDPWHGARLDIVSNCVHSAIDERMPSAARTIIKGEPR
ncbi:MAG: beta-lactamase family protein [Proteobacteria bacterium]|nr:beta-lactamase family protein [Pseudomonadota bacterium]